MTFTKIDQPKRTDEMFRKMEYEEHQKVESPLIHLPIDMIKDFVVADSLHLLELGVMKRLLIGWRTGDLGYNTKWSTMDMKEISELLKAIKMPKEVNRDARSLDLFAVWKGQEFSHFLNYYGPFVLKNYLPTPFYNHFLKLFCAVRICSSEKYKPCLQVAKLIFDNFINDYKTLYGAQFLTSNLHNLNHVTEDVERFGILQSINAYPFENYLGMIKKLLRPGKHPLTQIINRLSERLLTPEEDLNDEKIKIFIKRKLRY